MTIIEIGGLAGALVAVTTLITKLINLISAIQKLIHRIDRMQEDIAASQQTLASMATKVNLHETKLAGMRVKLNALQTA